MIFFCFLTMLSIWKFGNEEYKLVTTPLKNHRKSENFEKKIMFKSGYFAEKIIYVTQYFIDNNYNNNNSVCM